MELREEKEGYRLLDVPNHMFYVYAKDNGRILYAEDRQKNRSVYEYSVNENNNSIGESSNDRGLTRYVYDRKGNITEITDQNNKRYTVNTFDDKIRGDLYSNPLEIDEFIIWLKKCNKIT